MKILKFDSEENWMSGRLTRVTGTRKIMPLTKNKDKKLIGFYELIAERLALPADSQNPMERGHELESEAIEVFEEKTGKKVDGSLTIWVREDNESIAISPDGLIEETEAVEIKCLSSARHIEAYLKQEIPKEYDTQKIQYFAVNDKLETLYFCFYDPRLSVKQFFYITVKREDIADEIAEYLEFQIKTLEEVNSIVNKLTF
jgi:predicted phage-related endonuclease